MWSLIGYCRNSKLRQRFKKLRHPPKILLATLTNYAIRPTTCEVVDFATSQVYYWNMASPPRLFENGSFYHVYNRGNRKQQIFLGYKDYERFLNKTLEYKKKFNVNIVAFCLMSNHFHFLIQQLSPNTISKFFSDLCNSYSRYFNTKYETVGGLYQGRFKAKRIDKDEYLIHVSRYIHLNPVGLFGPSENLVSNLLAYRWSSLQYYLSSSKNEIIDANVILNYFSKINPVEDYKKFVISNIEVPAYPDIEHLVFEE